MTNLSILIATMPVRKLELKDLLENLRPQAEPHRDVEIIINSRTDINIGIKRNYMLKQASGEYVVFIDDDDHVSSRYVEMILKASRVGSDCIGISGVMTTNGAKNKQWHISKEFGTWYEKDNVYYRTPNHISPVKREIALKVGFPKIAYGEDHAYSKKILPYLKTETVIPGNIYHYDFKHPK